MSELINHPDHELDDGDDEVTVRPVARPGEGIFYRPPPRLTDVERATLSDDDRAMFDEALQAIPSEDGPLFTALLLCTRAIVAHDTSGLHTAAAGWPELLNYADERQQELVDAARKFYTSGQELQLQLTTLAGEQLAYVQETRAGLTALQEEMHGYVAEGRGDRSQLRRRLVRVEVAGGAAAVLLAALWLETIVRYGVGATIAGLLLLLVAVGVVLLAAGRLR
jgi:hypothetical protein